MGNPITHNRPRSKPPQELVCPISGSLMVDPVTVASGHVLDKISIQVCKNLGFIPILSDGTMCNISYHIPNHAVMTKILQWCQTNNQDFPIPIQVDELEKLVRALMESRQPPRYLICPISGLVFADPVVVLSGNSFDRNCVQACRNLNIVPVLPDGTKLDMSSVIIPNKPVEITVHKWCKEVDAHPPNPIDVKIAENIVLALKEGKETIELLEDDLSTTSWYLA